jgi:hypothetical protein
VVVLVVESAVSVVAVTVVETIMVV